MPEVSYLQSVADEMEQTVRRDAGIAYAKVTQAAQPTSEGTYGERTEMDPGLSSAGPEHYRIRNVRVAAGEEGIFKASRIAVSCVCQARLP